MESNGNLQMYGNPDGYLDPCTDGANEGCRRRMRRLAAWGWYDGWSSNSSHALTNYSGESIPKFVFDTEGTMTVWEYMYKNVPAIKPIQLWTMETNVSGASLVLALDN